MPVTTINLPSSVSQSLQSFANQYGLDSNVVQAVAQVESSGNQYDRSGAPLTSPAGAVGIMQVEPSTFNGLTAPAGQVFQSTGLPPCAFNVNSMAFCNLLIREWSDTYSLTAASSTLTFRAKTCSTLSLVNTSPWAITTHAAAASVRVSTIARLDS